MKAEHAHIKQLKPLFPTKTFFSPQVHLLERSPTPLKLKQMNGLNTLSSFHKGRFFMLFLTLSLILYKVMINILESLIFFTFSADFQFTQHFARMYHIINYLSRNISKNVSSFQKCHLLRFSEMSPFFKSDFILQLCFFLK